VNYSSAKILFRSIWWRRTRTREFTTEVVFHSLLKTLMKDFPAGKINKRQGLSLIIWKWKCAAAHFWQKKNFFRTKRTICIYNDSRGNLRRAITLSWLVLDIFRRAIDIADITKRTKRVIWANYGDIWTGGVVEVQKLGPGRLQCLGSFQEKLLGISRTRCAIICLQKRPSSSYRPY